MGGATGFPAFRPLIDELLHAAAHLPLRPSRTPHRFESRVLWEEAMGFPVPPPPP